MFPFRWKPPSGLLACSCDGSRNRLPTRKSPSCEAKAAQRRCSSGAPALQPRRARLNDRWPARYTYWTARPAGHHLSESRSRTRAAPSSSPLRKT